MRTCMFILCVCVYICVHANQTSDFLLAQLQQGSSSVSAVQMSYSALLPPDNKHVVYILFINYQYL